MVKKSRPSVKAESQATGEEEPLAAVKELAIPSGENEGIIDFYLFFNGIAILTGIIFIIVGLLRYVFHTL